MRRILLILVLTAAVAAGAIVLGDFDIGPVVITRADQQKLILLLGSPRPKATEPGLALRWPVIGEVKTFDRRWLHLGSEPKEIQTLDRERIVVDDYVIWRIADALRFYESFPAGMTEAETQIDQQVRAEVREVIGQSTLAQVISESRDTVMKDVSRKSNAAVSRFGVEIRDVRLDRTELPPRTEENVYARMRAERDRLARKYRAEGDEQARTIRAEADRKAKVIVADARGQAEIERGQGDAEAAQIYAEAYSKDPDFFVFVRSLQAYRKALGKDTTLVLRPDHPFFRILEKGAEAPQAPSGGKR
jgi:membrane protease subunit HflC